MGKDQQKAKSHNVGKENTEYLTHSCLGADNHSPAVGKARFPESETLTCSRPWLQAQSGPC